MIHPSSKYCSRCTQERSILLFWKEAATQDGLARWCKECYKEYGQTEGRIRAEKSRRNDPAILSYRKSYRSDSENKKRKNKNAQNRRATNPLEKLAFNLRCRTSKALSQTTFAKNSKFKEYVGCSLEHLKLHLEAQFGDGMSWNNYGFGENKWNIDHIIPLASAKNEGELFKLCHYTNLQPLWHLDNMIKGKSLPAT